MDIVKTITTKIRRHNFTFREGRRIYYGLQMDTTRLVWARNLCEGWQIDIDGRRITVEWRNHQLLTPCGVQVSRYFLLCERLL